MSDRAKYWNGSHWEARTAFSLAKHFPSGIPMNSRRLLCPCCHQSLSLVCAFNKVPYFRHPSAEEDKSCALRAQTYTLYGFYAGERQFPLKIHVVKGKIQFSIGFFKVDDELLKKGFNFSVEILTDKNEESEKKYHSDRLFSSTTTYLKIAQRPPLELIINSPEETKWPKSHPGVKHTGSLFDALSGKLLPNDADVVVGKKYFLLLRTGELRKNPYRFSVTLREQKIDLDGWELYTCKAKEATLNSAYFFHKYSANLTDQPVTITPIWPIVTRSSYEFCSTSRVVYIAITGDIQSKIDPEKCYSWLNNDIQSQDNQNQNILKVDSIYRPIISLGRSNLIKFVQVIYKKEENISNIFESKLILRTTDGDEITEEVLYENLKKDCLSCTSEINLRYEIYKDLALIGLGEIRAKVDNQVNLSMGQTLKIFNGKDLIRKLEIKHLKKIDEDTDHKFELNNQGLYAMAPLMKITSLSALACNRKLADKKQVLSQLKGLSMVQIYKLIK